jgi:hypothetical protein
MLLWTAVALTSACAVHHARRLDRAHGPAIVRDRQVDVVAEGGVDYWSDVRPILERRCVVCHGCYDAPCQLKLGSPEGLDRGASKDRVYQSLRPLQVAPTRLFEDARTTEQWREKRFHPVLNEREQTREANREGGLLLQLLELKRTHPVSPGERLPADVDLKLRRDEKCPTIEEFPRHARKHPHWGMPYGMPGLSAEEHEILVQWIEEGALHTPPASPPASVAALVARWEAFLNADSAKARLASRYIYEHLFLAHLYFAEDTSEARPHFFELVRSRTPPGEPIERIATRRPYDDPGVERPYYRLQVVRESVVAKLHLPYRLDTERMQRWQELFLDADYEVGTLPAYTPAVASNPFVAFRDIPVDSRYRFMLDESEFTLMGFIKGAVCRGPIALNVIDDHFWIFFVDPALDIRLHDAQFLHRHANTLRLPAASGSNAPPMVTWLRHAARQKKYMKAKAAAIREDHAGRRLTLDMLWDGDGHNPNASLTVFRHFDSASVVQGMVGHAPKTAWVIGYPLLERIHYLLVAGFDVFGNAGHQLTTRSYMDFLRMEAEFGFLALLPSQARSRERDFWYRGTSQRIYREVVNQGSNVGVESGITFRTDTPKLELYDMLHARYGSLSEGRYTLDDAKVPQEIATPLGRLEALVGHAVSWMPHVAFLHVPDAPEGMQVFTVIRNAAHLNNASLLGEKNRRVPAEDTLTVTRGFVGAYPNALYVVPRAELDAFVESVSTLATAADYGELAARFSARRTDPDFWATSDRLHALYREQWPIEAGLFDLSRIEDR